MMEIREYNDSTDRKEVIQLWKQVFRYIEARNDPAFSIDKKLQAGDRLFFTAKENDHVIGTIMGGYDGHRGWIYSLAVLQEKRKQKTGTQLLHYMENKLKAMGCVKINLQILASNEIVKKFYEKNGYQVEERISMGKVLEGE